MRTSKTNPVNTSPQAAIPVGKPLSLIQRVKEAEDDEDQFRPLEWSLIRRLLHYTKPVKGKMVTLTIMTIIRAAQLPALPWLVSVAIGRIGQGSITLSNSSGLMSALVAYAILALFTDFIFHFRQRLALEVGETVVNGLRSEIFAKVQRQPMSFFNRVKLGRILSRVTSDVESLRVGIQDVLFVSVIQLGQMLFTAVIMAWCDWVLFLVVVAMAPILWSINRRFHLRLSRLSRASHESFSRVTATLAESVSGIRVTQGFVRQDTNSGLFRNLLADHSRYNIALAQTSARLVPLLELNSQFFIAILLMLGGWRTFHGYMEIQDLIQFFFMANYFFSPIQTIGNQFNQALVAMAGAERVFRLVDSPPDWSDAEDATALPDPRRDVKRSTATIGAGLSGARVEFRKVSFGYNPERRVLHDIDFIAEPGQTIALVGHTGSGKSSIISLVAKFYLPTEGGVYIDDREIRTLTSESLHHQMGMVQQQNFLFTGTVIENIRLAKPDATDEEVRVAAARLDCLDILESLPQGLHTEVGERGAGLSVGQRQLVCFTRAFLADPRILILDEATSSIDAVTEARLQKALLALLVGRTSFVVAHRLSTIRNADLVLVLDQGRIIERGNHRDLMLQKGHYAALYEQFVRVDDPH
ncbi:MAG: ABC transporter ATP-binding protein/permease [Opitutaceae bacterium]|nr:ABC transporter ATP-binding protein/permease [Opitutaceae bacterium]